jgi:hypothetical protein
MNAYNKFVQMFKEIYIWLDIHKNVINLKIP